MNLPVGLVTNPAKITLRTNHLPTNQEDDAVFDATEAIDEDGEMLTPIVMEKTTKMNDDSPVLLLLLMPLFL
jgi:hypothetical protein